MADIMAGAMQFAREWLQIVIQFLRGGQSEAMAYITTGDSADHRILADSDHFIPVLTIVNSSTANSIKWGVGGRSVLTLLKSSQVQLWFCNPRKSQLTYNDGGTSGIEIDVYG
jgi:hypothetical protein